MPKTTKAHTTRPTPEIPPLVAAISRFTDPNYDGLPPTFAAAYAAAPALTATLAQGDEDSYFRLIGKLSGLHEAQAIAEGKTAKATRSRAAAMADALRILNDADPDHAAELTTPIMVTAFNVGLALACYMLTDRGAR